ncbi:type II toxin-antitoxin system RelE/ParE family toxin [Flavobacterium selenitireducens]|uniref:type II toxin-antitoxin system RelE/ParE family toxin n=1 Tax=Flavobacterium selenitireducens TaxID=2722704 RepID=UPI00168AB360|nr:type II toxin-antitoxin system RelE/ParE family toxin [Flavobacterium selenitireducens]MBD3583916.1 type II toxin-antitoxin system RelE/ParE family toxin [Flavobacterium selenitireducens]
MAGLKLFWTETAIRQRNLIFEYWIERNQSFDYSRKLNSKIKERTDTLKQNPELGKKTEFKNTRVVSLGHYSIFYQFDSNTIIVTGFWDNRQEPGKLLKFFKLLKSNGS